MMKELAEKFIRENGYTKDDFIDVDVSNELETDVCEWIDSIQGTLQNYDDYQMEYKSQVYEWVCHLLNIS